MSNWWGLRTNQIGLYFGWKIVENKHIMIHDVGMQAMSFFMIHRLYSLQVFRDYRSNPR